MPAFASRSFACFALAFLLSLAAGCRSYQLGHPAELPFETIFVAPADNESFAPQAQALVSSQLREAIIRDGRVRLVADREQADTVLRVTLTDYERQPATRNPNDTAVALDYDLRLTAAISLYSRTDGRYLLRDRQLSESSTAFVNDVYAPAAAVDTQSLVQPEYQAMPRLTRDLARRISGEVLGAW